jgi:hypothetical protein
MTKSDRERALWLAGPALAREATTEGIGRPRILF